MTNKNTVKHRGENIKVASLMKHGKQYMHEKKYATIRHSTLKAHRVSLKTQLTKRDVAWQTGFEPTSSTQEPRNAFSIFLLLYA